MRKKLDPFRETVTNAAILKSLPNKKSKVLDVGCGEGYLSRMMAKQGMKVWGVDFSSNLIEAAKKEEHRDPLGIQYKVADMRTTSFPSSSFDIVVSHQSIHEIPNPQKALQEFARILKKNGRVLLLFLHPCFDFSLDQTNKQTIAPLYFQKGKIQKGHYLVGGLKSPAPYFYLHLPLEDWTRVISTAGFDITQIEEPAPSRALLAKNSWWKKNFNRPRFIFFELMKKE